jgi:hypothetical protein
VSIDGKPIDVSIVGSTTRALNGSEVQMVPCGSDANGITLSAGTHVVQTAVGHNPSCPSDPSTCTGWNIDQMVLDSAAGGGAGPAVSPTAAGTPHLPATQPGPAPAVTPTASHIDSHTANLSGADHSFEYVLGQSVNKGWHAVATPGPGAAPGSHTVDLGAPQLVDGFANGWHVSAADLRALGGTNFTVALTWTPQNLEWAALALSAATLVLCLLLAFLPARARRWLRARLPRRLRGPAGPDAPVWPAAPFDSPRITVPFFRDPAAKLPVRQDTITRALVIGLVTGAVASLVVSIAWALVVAALVAAGLLLPWARVVATVGAVGFIVAGALNVIRGQQVHHYLAGSNWAGSFVHAGNLIWVGVVLLLADGVIAAFGLRTRKPLRRRAVRAGGAGATAGLDGDAAEGGNPDGAEPAVPQTTG